MEVPLTEEQEIEPEALLSAVTDRTRAVILCNPNNPSGTFSSLDRVRELADELPDGVILILDEAYKEFVDDPSYQDSHTLALERENVVMARTFSKAHGLAGLRVGYGIASETDRGLRRAGPVPGLGQPGRTGRGRGLDARAGEGGGPGGVRDPGARPVAGGFPGREPRVHPLPGQLRYGPVRPRRISSGPASWCARARPWATLAGAG